MIFVENQAFALKSVYKFYNDKIYKYITPQKPEIPKNSKITQNNITFNNNGKDEDVDSHFNLETLDKMIKDGKLK